MSSQEQKNEYLLLESGLGIKCPKCGHVFEKDEEVKEWKFM